MIVVDVAYLCDSICDCALWYYENNQEKFKFNFNVITQEESIHSLEEALQFVRGDVYVNILKKLEKEGNIKRFVVAPDSRPLVRIKENLTHPIQPMGLVETRNIDEKEKS